MTSSTQPAGVYPPPSTAGPASYGAPPPPPAGYPMTYGGNFSQPAPVPVETKTRGDGFWEGCCAAVCCCCALDACF